MSIALRLGLIAISTAIAFAPAIWVNVRTILDGSPTAYLLLAPFWALTVAYSMGYAPRGREINDAEFDMILVVLIIGVAGWCTSLAVPRIPAAAAYWHADLILPMIWILGLSIASFGVRRAFRAYPAWLFVAACFPPNFLLFGGHLGGSTIAFGLLTVGYAVAAITIALRHSKLKWFMPPVLLTVGSVLVFAIQSADPTVVYLVPAGLLTLSGFWLVRSSHQPFALALPSRSLAFVAVAVLATLLTTFTAPRPAPYLAASDLIRVESDWLSSLEHGGIEVTGHTTYDWGARVLGTDGSAQRFRLEHDGIVAYLDVFSTRELGRFASLRAGIWYGAAPPAHVEGIFRSDGSEIQSYTTLDSRLATTKSPDDPVWAAKGWYWRHGEGNDTVYQSMYLVTSRVLRTPDTVPTPSPPAYVSTVVEPIGWLIRADSQAPDIPPYHNAELTDLARLIASEARAPHS
ncbi:hypothetical protein [Mycolicibacterium pulveris]|uniref:hypothetical protein n=1 Tax=Mycolicibacterium pulveris TaxID=36813 RepID=UPI003CF781DB